MSSPYPGIKVNFKTKSYSIDITDLELESIVNLGEIKEITNYEYEVELNENKRKILILKPEYLGLFIQDLKNIMKYDKSSQTLDSNTKKVYNPKLKGV